MTDTELAPGIGLACRDRLGDRARPAGGRPPHLRRTFTVCTVRDLEQSKAAAIMRLEQVTGPLRCTPITAEVAIGDVDVAELLADLHRRGVDVDTLTPVAHRYGHISAAAHRSGTTTAALVVAECGTLTAQAYVAVPYS